jgi:membrane protease YdiL (CAAX protease family)
MLSRAFSALAAAAAVSVLASAAHITTPPPYVEGYVLFANGDCRSLICLRQFPALTIQ